ncbi:arabinose efflux permease family protein [Synechococcus sp. PCC 7502]|uniref:MFS transporter n=1 Tax=Synechococcus sp. PCC 7502 TaxID=1173263 RepID=UPI00029FDB07|nr:MFS transporter [Synechococcus sp. PCC 7502]AFY73585.1 arabinose efflux permease family protein [Synechococcus sp. PCC 7502]
MNYFTLFQSLRNPVFTRLYLAQTISLFGDALTWLGLALLAFELAGKDSAVVLSVALTLRVTAFVILSPIAGAIADRLDRKLILVITHIARMLIIGTMPFVNAVWQIYILVFGLNVFNAFFTPTYQATIPLVIGKAEYAGAIALSAATYQLLGVLGPGIAGSVSAWIGSRQIFFLDAISFAIAAVLIFTLPNQLKVKQSEPLERGVLSKIIGDVKEGTTRLFANAFIRYALFLQLVASISGAQILVNTVGYIKGTLKLSSLEYGWVMAAFGIGATIAAVTVGAIGKKWERTAVVLFGAVLITSAILPANYVGLVPLMLLWAIAGMGQVLVNLPTQTLIAEQIPTNFQGRVYGAHFAWSHLWWAVSYPIAGWLGSQGNNSFLYGSLIGFTLLAGVQVLLSPKIHKHQHEYLWHDHEHTHDEHHQHDHPEGALLTEPHTHSHEHSPVRHSHAHYTDIHHLHSH